jgi:hypothetical protein
VHRDRALRSFAGALEVHVDAEMLRVVAEDREHTGGCPFSTGVNWSVTVQVFPSLSVNGPLPAITTNGPVLAPTFPCNTPAPIFRIVKTFVELVPTAVVENIRTGDTESDPATLVPVIFTFTDGCFGSLLAMTSVVEAAPADVGAN